MSQKNATLIRKILEEEGFSRTAAAGALARMRQESNFNPLAINRNDAGKGKHSYGIFQWNRERFEGLKKHARKLGLDWKSVEAQARWFAEESRTTEKHYGNRLRNAKNATEAAEAAISMARPAGWSAKNPRAGHGWGNTQKWAKDLGAAGSGPLTLYARDEKAGKATETPKESSALRLISGGNQYAGGEGVETEPAVYDDGSVEALRAELNQLLRGSLGLDGESSTDSSLLTKTLGLVNQPLEMSSSEAFAPTIGQDSSGGEELPESNPLGKVGEIIAGIGALMNATAEADSGSDGFMRSSFGSEKFSGARRSPSVQQIRNSIGV